MVALASAFVRLRPDPDRKGFQRAGEESGRVAGAAAGKSYADGFYRDASGKLRQANGRFATDAQKAMIEGGSRAGKGFGDSFTKEGGGTIRRGFSSLKNDLGPLLIPAGIGAAVAAIGKIGIEYENNLNTLKAVTDATGAQMDQVAKKARELGADINLPGVSAAGAAKAMTELSKAGFTVQQSMDAARGTLQLARIAHIDEGEAAEIAANAVNAFGIKATEVDGVIDQLAATANSSSVEIKEVSYSFKQAAAVFSGVQGPAVGAHESITELNTAIAILGNNGIKGSDAGTSLKQMMLQLTGPSQGAKDIMKALAFEAGNANLSLAQQDAILHGSKKVRGETIAAIEKMNPGLKNMGDIAYDSNGKMRGLREILDLTAKGTKGMTQEEKNYAVTQVFGADASRAVLALLKGGLPVYDQMRDKVMQQGSAAKVAAAQNAGLGGAIDNVKGQFENAAIAIYNQVKGPLTTGLNTAAQALAPLATGIERFGNFVRENGGTIRDWAVAIGAVTVALRINTTMLAIQAAGGLLAYARGISIVTTTTRIWAGAQALLNATLLANPIGAIIVAIVAIGAALVLAYKHVGWFKTAVDAAWKGIKIAFSATIDWFVNTAWPALKTAWDAVASAAMWLWRNVFIPVWNGIKMAVQIAIEVVKRIVGDMISLFRAVATPVVWLYKTIFSPIFAAIRKVIEIFWVSAQIIFRLFVLYIKNVIVPAVQFFWRIAVSVFNAIVKSVQTWWRAVQAIFALFRTYVIGPLKTAFTFLLNLARTVFSAISGFIRSWYNATIVPVFGLVKAAWSAVAGAFKRTYETAVKPVFNAFSGFIKNVVVKGFQTGVEAIRVAWNKVQEYAKKPVSFVVNKVINPFIGGINKAASVVGVKDRIEPIKGFATGGQIPGTRAPGDRDTKLARVRQTGNVFAVGAKEFVTNARSTVANLPLVRAINAKRGKVTRDDVDPYLDGNDGPGRRGGDGFGDLWGKITGGLKGAANVVLNPVDSLKKMANSLLGKIPGAGMVKEVVKGSAKRMIDGALKWIGDKLSFGGIGGGSVAGGWKGMQNLISQRFPGLQMISGFRPGARTLSGNQSYHALGRAVDYPAVRALAAWIKATFGKKTKELITPWQDLNLNNGRPHTYTGAVWNQHNFAGGNAHVHWAARLGGLISRLTGMPMSVFDSGGPWRSGTIGVNTSGRTEYVDPNRNGDRGGITIVIQAGAFNGAVIANSKQAEDLVVRGVTSAVRNNRITAATLRLKGAR